MPFNKEQQSIYIRSYYKKNKERINKQNQAWYRSLAGLRHRFNRTLRSKGVTVEEYAYAWVGQDGLCAGCQMELDGGRNTHIDHCHQSGVFRGLLCAACNLALGKVYDSPQTLMRLAAYLQKNGGDLGKN